METNATISRMILYMYKIYANKYIWWNLIVKVGSILPSGPKPSAEQIHPQLCNHWQSSHHSFVFHWKSASAEPGGFLPSPPHAPWCAPPYQLARCQFQSLFQLGSPMDKQGMAFWSKVKVVWNPTTFNCTKK